MKITGSRLQVLLGLSFLCFDFFNLHAQEYSNQANLSKHTIGYSIGYAYPKLASGTKHRSVESGLNYGISGAFEWSKYYNSGISFMIAPQLYYSNLAESTLQSVYFNSQTGKISYEYEDVIKSKELEFVLPVAYEFPLFKTCRFSAGAYFTIPFISTSMVSHKEYDYVFYIPGHGYVEINPPIIRNIYSSDLENNFNAGLGVNAKILYPLNISDSNESYLSFEYWYTVSYFGYLNTHKTRFAISYVHRKIQRKEVREKWDRYWIRKNKSNI